MDVDSSFGSVSNRYEMPVYGLMILIVFWALYVVNAQLGFRVYLPLVPALFVSIIVNGHVNGKSVLFCTKKPPSTT